MMKKMIGTIGCTVMAVLLLACTCIIGKTVMMNHLIQMAEEDSGCNMIHFDEKTGDAVWYDENEEKYYETKTEDDGSYSVTIYKRK